MKNKIARTDFKHKHRLHIDNYSNDKCNETDVHKHSPTIGCRMLRQ